MKKQSLKISILILISLSLFFYAGKKAKSCGPDLSPDEYYSIMDKPVFDIPDLKPFFLSEYVFADQGDGTEESEDDNLNDWLRITDGAPAIDHIEKVVYKSTIEDMEKIRQSIKSKNQAVLPDEFRNNSFIKYLMTLNSSDIIDYLVFAKKCEPEVTNDNSWDEKKQDTGLMNELIETGIKLHESVQSGFIKDRYAYQVIRLAHYSGQYNKAVDLYNGFFTSNTDPGLIQYWSLAHKAGAMKSLGKVAEANLTFIRIFDKCKSRRRQSVLSVDLSSDSIFNATLKLCESTSDKILLYTLSAYKVPEKSIENMDAVFRLDPKSEYPELLLSREVTKLERRILPTKANWNGQKAYVEENSDNAVSQDKSGEELYEKVSAIAKSGTAGKPYLWNFAAGYIATLLNRTEDADAFYFAAKKQCQKSDMSVVRRIQVAEIVSKVNGLKKIDRKTEDELAPDIEWIYQLGQEGKYNAKDAFIYIMNTLAKRYWKQGDEVKMNLCLGIRVDNENYYWGYNPNVPLNPFGYDIRKDYHLEPVDQITKLISDKYNMDDWYKANSQYRKKYGAFERFLIDHYVYSTSALTYIQVKSFIAKGMFDKAVEKLNQNNSYYNDDGTEQLQADPFLVHIIDCHDCDYLARNVNRYSVLSFAKRMVELQKLAVKDPANAAEYYFLIANGLYNKSYYGNSWVASSFYRTSSSWGYYKGFNKDFYDCSQAKQYYLKAMGITKNKEFAAKCLYMASKCEQNDYYNTPVSSEQENVPLEYRTCFKKLKNEYSDTKYYKELLKECKFFSNFVSR